MGSYGDNQPVIPVLIAAGDSVPSGAVRAAKDINVAVGNESRTAVLLNSSNGGVTDETVVDVMEQSIFWRYVNPRLKRCSFATGAARTGAMRRCSMPRTTTSSSWCGFHTRRTLCSLRTC